MYQWVSCHFYDSEEWLRMTPAPGSSVFVLAVLISTSLLYSSCSELKGLLICRWLKHLCTAVLHGRCTKISADPKLKAQSKYPLWKWHACIQDLVVTWYMKSQFGTICSFPLLFSLPLRLWSNFLFSLDLPFENWSFWVISLSNNFFLGAFY